MSLHGMEVFEATGHILGNFKDGSIGGRFIMTRQIKPSII